MVLPNFEEKEKLFTEVISKIPIKAILQTTTNRIIGKIHIRPSERLKDELDRSEIVLAVTDAEIFDLSGVTSLFKTKFLAVQISQIVWVLPESELEPENQGVE
jgi:hypothetical protein